MVKYHNFSDTSDLALEFWHAPGPGVAGQLPKPRFPWKIWSSWWLFCIQSGDDDLRKPSKTLGTPWENGGLMGFYGMYPLAKLKIAIENGYLYWVVWFSIAILVYQRVTIQKWQMWSKSYSKLWKMKSLLPEILERIKPEAFSYRYHRRVRGVIRMNLLSHSSS